MRGRKIPVLLAEQAKALYPLYEDYTAVANILHLPQSTVRSIIVKDDEFMEFRQQQKRILIQKAHQKASETLEAIKPEKMKSNTEGIIVFGTLVDKMAVLSGETNKWSQQINVGDNRKINIVVKENYQSLLNRKKELHNQPNKDPGEAQIG